MAERSAIQLFARKSVVLSQNHRLKSVWSSSFNDHSLVLWALPVTWKSSFLPLPTSYFCDSRTLGVENILSQIWRAKSVHANDGETCRNNKLYKSIWSKKTNHPGLKIQETKRYTDFSTIPNSKTSPKSFSGRETLDFPNTLHYFWHIREPLLPWNRALKV